MKEIKILHLFPKLLSLYGEYGNVAILSKVLTDAGHSVTVDGWESGPLDLAGWDFIYMGSGTEENLLEAGKRLLPHKDAVQASIEGDALWLVTGTAQALFGASMERSGEASPALSVFPYTTRIETAKRYNGDALGQDDRGSWYVGFVNTANSYQGMDNPLMTLALNPKLGNDKAAPAEGMVYRNFHATQLIGPVLTKNPHLLGRYFQHITGQPLQLSPDSNIQMAYQVALGELKKRAGITE